MDDIEDQLARLGEHREAQLVADELSTPDEPALPSSTRRLVLVAAVLLGLVGVGVVWSAQTDDSVGDTAADITISDLDDPTETAVPSELDAQQFESRLWYRVTLPVAWGFDTTPEADNWSDSMVGEDGGFFRARVFDRPDRSPYVDSVENVPPSLEEAAPELAGLFPLEFGTDPTIETTTIDGRVGYRIQPSPDADSPGTVIFLFDAPATSWRFIEFAVDAAHESEIIDSLVWLAEPAPTDPSDVGHQNDLAGRRALEDLFDAMAADEWEIAAEYLLSSETEWPGPPVAQWIGEYDPLGDSLPMALRDYCATALCGAPYIIGDSETSDNVDNFPVTFESDDGPVTELMTVYRFEGEVIVNSVPPPGASDGSAVPIDVRVFGEPYPGNMAVLRYKSAEFIQAGNHLWRSYLHALYTPPAAIAGDFVVAVVGDTIRAFAPSARWVDLAEAPAVLGGTAAPGGVPMVFVIDDFRTVRAIDPVDARSTPLLDLSDREESVYAVDASGDRLAVHVGIGESTAIEVYEFDPQTLEAGDLVARIDPGEYIGAVHLSPDGRTLAATLDPTFYDPTQTVAIIDTTNGTVSGRWSVDGNDVIDWDSVDYDGRFIVAHLANGGIFVVDTANNTTRRVNTNTTIRFE